MSLTLVPPTLPPPHPDVDTAAEDPCLVDGRRVCIAATKAGERCRAPAAGEGQHCTVHAGLLDSAAGGKAKAARIAQEKEEARALAVEAHLGTRAIVARVFQEQHEDVRKIVSEMISDCLDPELPAKERRAMRLALIPWLNQGHGMPKESVEVSVPTSVDDVESMTLDELREAAKALASAR